jgi:hypothetical protein
MATLVIVLPSGTLLRLIVKDSREFVPVLITESLLLQLKDDVSSTSV